MLVILKKIHGATLRFMEELYLDDAADSCVTKRNWGKKRKTTVFFG